MTRRTRILRNTAIGILGVAAFLIVAALLIVRTQWFGNYVRQTIISSVEESTGGRVDVGSFQFDESHLRATVRDLVIHGTEPRNAPPFVSIARIEVDFRLFTTLRRPYDISFVGIDRPQVNVALQVGGRSNIPTPRKKSTANTSALQTIVDLAADRLDLSDGLVTLFSVRQPLTMRGNSVRVHLDFSIPRQAYDGTFTIEPLYVLNGRNTPVNFTVSLPLTLTKDRIDLHHATVTTPLSQIAVDGSIGNMQNPRVDAHVQGRIAGADLAHLVNVRLLPDLSIETVAAADSRTIQVTTLHAAFGKSNLEASGPLKSPSGNGSLELRADLALQELGQLASLSTRLAGTLEINARASIDQANRYSARGNFIGRNLALTQGKTRVSGIGVVSSFDADPQTVNLRGLRISGFGGELLANASLAGFARYKIDGAARGIDIQAVLRGLGEKLPYDGRVSGTLAAQGDLKAPGLAGLAANAHLTIAPGNRGIPVSGRMNADYKGSADDVVVQNSWIALPRTRLNLSGSMKRQLNVSLSSKDIHDLAPSAPVTFGPGGEADFSGAVTGALSNPRIAGRVNVQRFAVEGRQFDSLNADVAASSSAAAVTGAILARGTMQAHADARVALAKWSPVPRSAISVNAGVSNGDLADILALAGEPAAGYGGALSAQIHVNGTYGNPAGTATIQAVNGTLDGEPFNQIHVQADLTDQLATLRSASIDAPAGRVDLSGEFHHPRDSFSIGQVHAHVHSAALNVKRAEFAGRAAIDADLTGTLQHAKPAFLLSAVNGDVSAKSLDFRGVNYGDLTATVHTAGHTVAYKLTSDFAGSSVSANGRTELTRDYPTNADLKISALPIERVLAAAGRSDVPAKGIASGSVHFQGSVAAPQGNAQIDLAKANLYGEAIDQAHLRLNYLAQSIDVPQLEIVSGPSRIDATARFDHPVNELRNGQARFTLTNSHLDFARSGAIQRVRPGLSGTVDVNANGSATIRASNPGVLITALNANLSANGIAAAGKQFGNLKFTANTTQGQRVNFALNSNLAGSTIQGSGSALLNPQYPIDARLSVRNAAWTRFAALIGPKSVGAAAFEATADGDIAVQGPLLDTKQLNGSLELAKLDLTTIPRSRVEKPITISNQGPIRIALDRGTVRIENAHITGPNTNLEATGSGSLTGQNLNLNLRANADLGVAQNFDRDVYSSGNVSVSATVRGDLPKPLVNGELTLQNAAFSTAALPLGISNANGTVVFNGNSARITKLTADSGGGKLSVSGFASLTDTLRFALQANATNVRVRTQGVSAAANANIRLTGTSDNSHVTGNATVTRVTYAAQSDIGSMLSQSPPPVQSPQTSSSLLSNMKLDIRVRSLPGMTVQSTLSEDLQTDIDLRLRGTAGEPAVLGRISVSSGKLVFFGTTYTVDTGTIAFYNPLRVEPVLDVSLETQAQGVNVTVRVTGPVENMKLSYTSDPPLQFQEIISLLAAGTTPTSDPTLLANQTAPQQQGFQQMGESALLGQAVANPVGNQLQRVFGVTQLKIDPSFTTGSAVPTARLALQQRITNNLTFTYVSAIDAPNSTIVKVEWAFSPTWSAVATRDQFGLFSLNFFYKRGFR